jgi:two-component system, NtrC family, sensor kinase
MTVRFSITLKLLLLILPLICLPIAITGYFSIHAAVDRVNRLVRQEQMNKVSAAADKIANVCEKMRIDLGTITTLPVLEDYYIARSFRLRAETAFNRDTIARLFQDFIRRTPYYYRIQYLDQTGTALITVNRSGNIVYGTAKGSHAFFSRMRHRMPGDVFISDITASDDAHGSVMHWSKAVFSAMHEFIGVVVIDLDFESVIRIVNAIHVGESGYAFLVDQFGRVVVHPHYAPYVQSLEKAKDSHLKQMVEKMMTGATGWDLYSFDGEQKIAAFTPISPMGWSIAVTIPTAELKKEAHAIQKRAFQVVALTLGFAILGLSVLSYFILRPVRDLVTATQQIAAGDLNQEIPIHSGDELGDLTRSFNRMVKNLIRTQNELVRSEKLISVGRLSAGMAHEIRNPLNAMKGAVVHIQRRRPDDPLVQEYTQLVSEEIDRLNAFVTDFLYFARQAKPKPVPTDLNQLILSVQQLFTEQAQKGNIRFSNRLEADLPPVLLDAHQIEQVMVNLMINAMDSLPDGGEMAFSTFPLKSGNGTAHRVRVELRDNGIGIPESHLQSIFDPFFSTKESGTGIGLPLSLGIIENHGGTLTVRPGEQRGTLVTLELPVQGPAGPTAPEEAAT